jgi:8-amino-7-oxononanoate synthase
LSIEDDLQADLDEIQRNDGRRFLRTLDGPDRLHPVHNGRPLLSFCSNDYLGLASHPELSAAAADAAAAHGFGSGASRLVSGGSAVADQLEGELASFVHQPAALLFPSGYQTNIGVLTALAGPNDLIVSDAANHASIVDGCRLTRARLAIYRHTDPDDAGRAFATAGTFRRRILVTESLFSMDGTRAPLPALAALAQKADALFLVDEAHALGVLGPRGAGLCAAEDLRPHVTMGTLGKSMASLGGFAASSVAVRELLLNTARTFIFTTAPPHPVLAAALAALRLIRSAEGDQRRSQLQSNLTALRAALAAAGAPLPGRDAIIPVILGSNQRALEAAAELLSRDILIPAIRPPTVPVGTARLRVTLSASHTPADVATLSRALIHILSAPTAAPLP